MPVKESDFDYLKWIIYIASDVGSNQGRTGILHENQHDITYNRHHQTVGWNNK